MFQGLCVPCCLALWEGMLERRVHIWEASLPHGFLEVNEKADGKMGSPHNLGSKSMHSSAWPLSEVLEHTRDHRKKLSQRHGFDGLALAHRDTWFLKKKKGFLHQTTLQFSVNVILYPQLNSVLTTTESYRMVQGEGSAPQDRLRQTSAVNTPILNQQGTELPNHVSTHIRMF